MRELRYASLDRTRPVVVLTRETARPPMTKVTVAPITTMARGLTSEVRVGPENGLDVDGVISIDNTVTIPVDLLGDLIGILTSEQEKQLARAVVLAYDLDLPVVDIIDPDSDSDFQPLTLVYPADDSPERTGSLPTP